ncbi:MAG TPA: NAD-dependent succinate-semialdehyde dehydrogenase [Acidimicrobiales bacterium]|nr:NAD-dependent succinate-semialdehyde dehydrogenase [Acidimicrobiales bacterium]
MAPPHTERTVVDAVPKDLFIAGRWVEAASERRFPVDDPSTDRALCEVADAGADDGLAALAAATAAQQAWARHPPRERGEILRRAWQSITDRADDLALLITLEMGKPLAESKAEVAYGAEFLRWFSEEAVRIDGGYGVAPNGQGRLVTLRQPVGPCLLVTPWNFPLAMGTRKIGPAVAAGCTMVVKPAEQTPLTMLALGAILDEAGLPPGVCNVVPTSAPEAVVGPLLADRRLRKLSFTGSTETGRLLMAQAAPNVLRVTLELGGNAAFVVFDDADLDLALEGAIAAKMRNVGEACTAANRFLVAGAVADEFAVRLAQRMASLTVGRGTDAGVDVGPLIDSFQRAKVVDLVDDAVRGGARVLTGGRPPDGPGSYYPPTVLTDVPRGARMLYEEIFGPVAPVVPFSAEDEAIATANDTEYGLVGYVFTRDLDRAIRVAERLETGMVGINQGVVSNPAAPLGGVKHSGFGREGGHEGTLAYLDTKYVAIRT